MLKQGGMAVLIVLIAAAACTDDVDTEPGSRIMVDARYQVFPPTIRFGDTPKAMFRNMGNVPLEYGNEYTLEYYFEDEWVELSQPDGADVLCIHTREVYLLAPGVTKDQEIVLCDRYGRVDPLAAGEYRVTKTALTITSTPDAQPEEVTRVASFTIEPAAGGVPPASACKVLCMSQTEIERGDVVTVTFDPPRRYIWGALSELHEGDRPAATLLAHLVGWQKRDEALTMYWPEDRGGVEDIGFVGLGEWKWKVPERLEPGIYTIAKEGTRGGSAPLAERLRTWWVAFEVTK